MPITLNGDTGITTPGLTNTGSTTLVSLTTTGNTILGDQSTDTLNVANGNLVLNSSGNLGIGTASPIGVANYQGITIGGTNGGLIRFQSGASTQNAQIAANTSGLEIECVNTGIPIKFYTGGSLRATLDSSGNLGIGTASPAARLDVVSSSYPNFITNRSLSTGGSGSNAWTAAQLKVTTTEQMSAGFGVQQEFVLRDADAVDNIVAAFVVLRDGADNSGALSFRTAAAGTLTERARITSAGNVGIGTTSPATKLEVSNGAITAGDVGTVLVGRYSSSFPSPGAGYFSLSTNNSDGNNGGLSINTLASGTLSERVRVDQSGNVGIGTTSPNAKLQIDSGDIRLQGSAPGKLLFFSTGNGVSQNATFEVQNDGATTNTGEFRFSTRNQAGTLAERMRLGAEGKLCINRTSTINGAWLAIQAENNQTAIGTIWADNTYMIQQRFSDSYFMGIGGDANGRNLSLVANSADATAKITFWTSGNGTPTERARFTSAGDFDLYVTPAKDGQLRWTSGAGGAVQAFIYANGNPELIAQTGGSGGVKLTSGATSWVSASDIRNKNIIEPITNAVAKIATLSSVIYSFKDDEENTRRAGLVAQELLEVLPEAVYVPAKEDELLGVRYSEVTPLLVAAIKELKSELDSVKTELAALKGN